MLPANLAGSLIGFLFCLFLSIAARLYSACETLPVLAKEEENEQARARQALYIATSIVRTINGINRTSELCVCVCEQFQCQK